MSARSLRSAGGGDVHEARVHFDRLCEDGYADIIRYYHAMQARATAAVAAAPVVNSRPM